MENRRLANAHRVYVESSELSNRSRFPRPARARPFFSLARCELGFCRWRVGAGVVLGAERNNCYWVIVNFGTFGWRIANCGICTQVDKSSLGQLDRWNVHRFPQWPDFRWNPLAYFTEKPVNSHRWLARQFWFCLWVFTRQISEHFSRIKMVLSNHSLIIIGKL